MFKRIRWLVLGGVLGVWLFLRLRDRARQIPAKAVDAAAARGAEVAATASRRGRDLSARFKDALREGRAAMQAKEAELRAGTGSRD